MIRDFVELLDILYQTEGLTIEEVLESGQISMPGQDVEPGSQPTSSQFAEFDI